MAIKKESTNQLIHRNLILYQREHSAIGNAAIGLITSGYELLLKRLSLAWLLICLVNSCWGNDSAYSYTQIIPNPCSLTSQTSTLNLSDFLGFGMQVTFECTHKQQRLFRLVMDARVVLVLLIIWMIWGILRVLRIL